jgi:hypothetical protein
MKTSKTKKHLKLKNKKHKKHKKLLSSPSSEGCGPCSQPFTSSVSISAHTTPLMWNNCPRFPDFGKEVKRSYPIHEYCYDCRRLVKGCKGWKVTRKFNCTRAKWYKRVKAE